MLPHLRYFLCGPCPIVRACVCVLIDVCVQLLLYMFRGQHKIIPQHSRSKSSTKPPSPFSTCQFKMATRPLLFSPHAIPWAIAKYTPCEPYTTYFDRPTGRPSCHDCSNSTSSVKHRPTMRAEPTKCWFVSKRKEASRA